MASSDSAMRTYLIAKIEELEQKVHEKSQNVTRLQAQRNELNNSGSFNIYLLFLLFSIVRQLKDEIQALQESGSYVGEVVKQMGKDKVLVKVFSKTPGFFKLNRSILMENMLSLLIQVSKLKIVLQILVLHLRVIAIYCINFFLLKSILLSLS